MMYISTIDNFYDAEDDQENNECSVVLIVKL